MLVLDDDPSLRLLCRVNLELDGFRVLEASSVACAREALAREAVDAILLDVHVEDGDGRELLRELGAGRPPTALFTGTEPFGAVSLRQCCSDGCRDSIARGGGHVYAKAAGFVGKSIIEGEGRTSRGHTEMLSDCASNLN